MNLSSQNDLDRNAATMDAELSLRLIASLPAPAGIEDRVKAGLRGAPAQTGVLGWPLSAQGWASWGQVSYLRAAAAAAIVFVVAGGGWGVYKHFGLASAPTADAMEQRIERGGGLSAAGARRTPKTVEGPRIAVPKAVTQETDAGSISVKQRAHGARRPAKKNSIPPAVR